MNLGESLSLLKKEKSRLARLIVLRKSNLYIEKDAKPEFDVKKISEDIDNKISDIRKLKIRIQKANLSTNIPGEEISLAEAIIKVNDIRSKISSLNSLFDRKREWLFHDKDEKEKIPLISESSVEDQIEKLENEKNQLDNKIQMANWVTKLPN